MDEKASRRFICCKCSVCMCEVVCVRACEAYHVPSMELCSVGGIFSVYLCLRIGLALLLKLHSLPLHLLAVSPV